MALILWLSLIAADSVRIRNNFNRLIIESQLEAHVGQLVDLLTQGQVEILSFCKLV